MEQRSHPNRVAHGDRHGQNNGNGVSDRMVRGKPTLRASRIGTWLVPEHRPDRRHLPGPNHQGPLGLPKSKSKGKSLRRMAANSQIVTETPERISRRHYQLGKTATTNWHGVCGYRNQDRGRPFEPHQNDHARRRRRTERYAGIPGISLDQTTWARQKESPRTSGGAQ